MKYDFKKRFGDIVFHIRERWKSLIVILFSTLLALFLGYFFLKYFLYDIKDTFALIRQADDYRKNGEYDKALKYYDFAHFLWPEDTFFEFYLGAAECYANQGKFKKSKQYLLRSLESDSRGPQVMLEIDYGLAQIYFRERNFDKSKLYLDNIIKNPKVIENTEKRLWICGKPSV